MATKTPKRRVISKAKHRMCSPETNPRKRRKLNSPAKKVVPSLKKKLKKCKVIYCQCNGSKSQANYKAKLRSHHHLAVVKRAGVTKCNKCGLSTCPEFVRVSHRDPAGSGIPRRSLRSESSSSSSNESDYVTYRVRPRRVKQSVAARRPAASVNKRKYARSSSSETSSSSSSGDDWGNAVRTRRKRQRVDRKPRSVPKLDELSSDEESGQEVGSMSSSTSGKKLRVSKASIRESDDDSSRMFSSFVDVERISIDPETMPSTSQGQAAIKQESSIVDDVTSKRITRSAAKKSALPLDHVIDVLPVEPPQVPATSGVQKPVADRTRLTDTKHVASRGNGKDLMPTSTGENAKSSTSEHEKAVKVEVSSKSNKETLTSMEDLGPASSLASSNQVFKSAGDKNKVSSTVTSCSTPSPNLEANNIKNRCVLSEFTGKLSVSSALPLSDKTCSELESKTSTLTEINTLMMDQVTSNNGISSSKTKSNAQAANQHQMDAVPISPAEMQSSSEVNKKQGNYTDQIVFEDYTTTLSSNSKCVDWLTKQSMCEFKKPAPVGDIFRKNKVNAKIGNIAVSGTSREGNKNRVDPSVADVYSPTVGLPEPHKFPALHSHMTSSSQASGSFTTSPVETSTSPTASSDFKTETDKEIPNMNVFSVKQQNKPFTATSQSLADNSVATSSVFNVTSTEPFTNESKELNAVGDNQTVCSKETEDIPPTKIHEPNIIAKQEVSSSFPENVTPVGPKSEGVGVNSAQKRDSTGTSGYFFGTDALLENGALRPAPAAQPVTTDPSVAFGVNIYNQWVVEQNLAADKKQTEEESS